MTALLLGLGVCGLLIASGPTPAHWLDAERSLSATAGRATPTVEVWHGLSRALPVGDLPLRPDLLVVVLIFIGAAVATLIAHALFRGPGRWAAAAAAGPVAALSLSRWAFEVGAGEAVPGLVVSALASLSLASVVRSRVHFGRVTPVAAARALAAATAITLVSLRAALPLLLLTVPMTWATARGRRSDGRRVAERDPGPHWSRWLTAAAIGVLPMLLAAVVLGLLRGTAPVPDWPSARVSWPGDALSGAAFAGIVYPAGALLLVMTFVLRWRGGPWLWAWALLPLIVADDHGAWVPHSVVLVVVAVASCGWVWLAGLTVPTRPRLSRLIAATAAIAVGVLSWSSGSRRAEVPTAVAQLRPTGSLVSVYARGLLAPGDVLIAHDAWLHEALRDRHGIEGWRPDIALVAAGDLGGQDLARLSLDWRATGRRVLSDSYNLGGRWNPAWAIDSGPLFWFVGESNPAERDFTDLSPLFPAAGQRDAERARRWTRLAIERSRFRRAVDDAQAALGALPLHNRRYRSLLTRLQLARSARTEQAAGSELPGRLPDVGQSAALDEALVLAEAGDLLYSHGEQERASELLIAAANDGYTPAWGALARWQLRAGSTSAANATMSAIAGSPELRGEALAVLRWLVSRDRVADARELVDVLGPVRGGTLAVGDAALEASARLRLLDAMAERPPGFDVPVPAPAIGRR